MLSIQRLRKSFGQTEIFQDLDLDIARGKITALFGPNASGKSTLLNILAGITEQDSGTVLRAAASSEMSYIFQNYRESLLPWRTNFENVALPLEIRGVERAAIRERVEALQRLFRFTFDWNGYPYQLSGGQQQMLAFARALITDPDLLLVDEPFSALDYENNLALREHLQAYYLARKPTIVLVTHNIEEAVHLADHIAVFSRKPATVVAQIDNPLPYPRTLQTLKLDAFDRVEDSVLSAFEEAVRV